MFALERDVGHGVCVFLGLSVRKKRNGRYYRDRETQERERKAKSVCGGGEGEEEVGSWHRLYWLSLNRTSFHTHYTCPLQASHRTSTGAALSKTGLLF